MALATRAHRVLAVSTLSLFAIALSSSPANAQSVTFGASGGPPSDAPAAAPAAPASTPSAGAPAASAASTPAAATPAATGDAPAAATVAAPVAEGGGGSPEWLERDRQLGEASSLGGGVGLLHMQHAQGGAPGQFRMGFASDFFSAGFLCTPQAPCPGPNGASITSDTMNHVGATLTLSATLLKWLEAYISTGVYANSDNANQPALLQVLGDTTLGVKAFGGLSKVFWVGGGADLLLVNGTGAVGLDGNATSAKFRAIGTADLRGLESHFPLRISLNTTYSLDNTGDVLASTEAQSTTMEPVPRIDRFGLGVNRVDHVDINLGVETFLVNERIRPFVEYGLMIPINRQGYVCSQALAGANGDGCLGADALAPSKLTLGSRFYPWKNGFNLLLAMDIGVTGVSNFIEEVAPTPPWTLYVGGGWAIDVWDRPPVEVTKIVEKPMGLAKGGRIKGFVHEKDKEPGVGNAIVAFDGHPEITSLATGADGRFTTSELPAGPYKFLIHADGYKDGACETTVASAAQDVQLDCPLEALPRVGNVVGHVRDAETQGPVSSAGIKLVDPAGKELRLSSDSEGAFKFENVAPGAVSLEVDAAGYMALVQPATVKARQDNNADLAVLKKPKNPLVEITAKEITIKQQIQFALDSAVILPESNGLMTEIADTLIKNARISRIEVQGHTDNTGTTEHNKILSEQRANAVRDWLTSHGVAPDRLVARGYGQDKPLVPNVTPAMKAKNRRVQFIILEQQPASSLEKK
jgi:outer membrane protein OmpA-like peptidoglycan-associated protein